MRKLLDYWLEALFALCILLCLAQNAHCAEKKITNYGYSVTQYIEPDKTIRFRVIVNLHYDDGTYIEKLYAVETVEPKEGKHAIRNARKRALKDAEDWMDKTEDSLADK